MASLKLYLKLYSLSLGFVVSFLSFLWLMLVLFILSQTDPTAKDLLMARYLDISFGLLAFTSSLALVYGAFVESKTWLSVWTLGSATVLIGTWVFYFYRKYGQDNPEDLKHCQDTMMGLSVAYALLVLPVVLYYKCLEAPEVVEKACEKTRQYKRQVSEAGQKAGRNCWCFKSKGNSDKNEAGKDGYRIAVPIEEDLFNPV